MIPPEPSDETESLTDRGVSLSATTDGADPSGDNGSGDTESSGGSAAEPGDPDTGGDPTTDPGENADTGEDPPETDGDPGGGSR